MFMRKSADMPLSCKRSNIRPVTHSPAGLLHVLQNDTEKEGG